MSQCDHQPFGRICPVRLQPAIGCSVGLNGGSPGPHAIEVSVRAARRGQSPGGVMASTAVHQVTLSARTAIIVVVAFLAAVALAVSLPLALRTTHTVFVPTGSGLSTSTSNLSGVAYTSAAHGR